MAKFRGEAGFFGGLFRDLPREERRQLKPLLPFIEELIERHFQRLSEFFEGVFRGALQTIVTGGLAAAAAFVIARLIS